MSQTNPLDIALDYSRSTEPGTRANACVALAEIGGDRALARLCELAQDQRQPQLVQEAAIKGLIKLVENKNDSGGKAAAAVIERIRSGQDKSLRRYAMNLASRVPSLRDTLIETFKAVSREDQDPSFRREVQQLFIELAETDPQAVEVILESAVSETDPSLQQRAAKAIERLTGSGQAQALRWDIAKLEPSLYGWLAKARRMGLFRPQLDGAWPTRWRQASAAAKADGPRRASAIWRPVAVAVGVAFVVIFLLWALLGFLAAQPLNNDELIGFGVLALVAAVVVALVALPGARPLARSADRAAAALLELRTAAIAGAGVGLAFGLVVQLAHAMDDAAPPMAPTVFVLEIVASMLALAVALVLMRGVTIAVYGLNTSQGGRVILVMVAGLLASVPLAVLAVWLVGLAVPNATLIDLAEIAFVGLPAILGLLAGYFAVDLDTTDALPEEDPAWQWPALGMATLSGLAVIGLVLLGHRDLLDTRALEAAVDKSSEGKQELKAVLLARTDYRLRIEDEGPLAMAISDVPQGFEPFLFLDEADRTSLLRHGSGGERTAFLRQGTYLLRVDEWSTSTATGLDLGEATNAVLHFAAYGMARLTGAGRSDWAPGDSPDSGLVQLSLILNTRDITKADFDKAKETLTRLQSQRGISGSKPAPAADGKSAAPGADQKQWRYAVVVDERNQPYALGSLLAYYGPAGAADVPYHPAAAWPRDLTSAVQPAGLVELSGRPSEAEISELELVHKVMAEEADRPKLTTLLGTGITASRDQGSEPVKLLGELTPMSGNPGSLAVYAGGDPGSPVAIGTLLRQTGEDDGDLALFEIIGGRATAAEPRHVRLSRDAVLEVAGGDYAAARQLSEQALKLGIESSKDVQTDIPYPEELPPLASAPIVELEEELEDLRAQQGQWQPDVKGPAPPEFSHFFMVMEDSPVGGFSAGAILQGSLWDNSTWPLFKEIFPGSGTAYEDIGILAYLGPTYDPRWERIGTLLSDEPTQLPQLARLTPGIGTPDTIDDVAELKGRWLTDVGVYPSGPEPEQFRHYFMLASDGEVFKAGSIVRGSGWDRTDWPQFELTFGWAGSGETSAYEYLISLTYLGPTYRPEWEQLAAEMRRAQGLSPDDPPPYVRDW